MFLTARKTLATVAVLAAAALGGSALATAATSGSSSSSSSATAAAAQTANSAGPGGGPHVGANGKTEVALTGDTAAKVKAAALDKVPGGTVERVETDVDHGSPYEAHVTKSDGTQLEVLVDADFAVTAVNTMMR
jgi:uncharacterized membrane protein YkoI